MTVRDAIDAALLAALTGLAAELEVEPAGDPSQFPALDITWSGTSVLEREASLTRYAGEITVGGYVGGGGGTASTAERNALQAAVVAAIMADETLGGTVELVEDGDCRFATAALASVPRMMFAQDFTIQFTNRRGDPALPA